MIRLLLGSALPIVGLGLVAAFAGPDLVTGLQGTPMIVAGADQPRLEPARFDGEACAAASLFRGAPAAEHERARMRIVAVALGPDGQDFEVAIENPGNASETITLLFDESGRLAAVSKPRSMEEPAAVPHRDCLGAPKPTAQGPI